MMALVPRIAAVSYLDTLPFLYGIRHEGNFRAELSLSSPETAIRHFIEGKADLALLPVAAVPALEGAHPVTGYCIGTAGASGAAVLAGKGSVAEARRVWFDSSRQTEVQLVKYLMRKHWKITPEFFVADSAVPETAVCGKRVSNRELAGQTAPSASLPQTLAPGDFRLLTGEQALVEAGKYPTVCDLSAEWRRAARLPFVFWLWMAHDGVDPDWVEGLHAALTYGIEHTYEAVVEAGYAEKPYDAYSYLTAFDYLFDNQKQKALHKFWNAGIKVAPRTNPG